MSDFNLLVSAEEKKRRMTMGDEIYLRPELNKRISNPGCYRVVGIGPTVLQQTIIKLFKIYKTNAFFIYSKNKY